MAPTLNPPRVYNNALQTARAALQDETRITLEENLATLRYLEGSGVTIRQKLRIRSDTAYLLIGLGGQGINKLKDVKRQLERDCDAEDIENYVRFLAVDTDTDTLDSTDFQPTEKVEIYAGIAEQLAEKNSPQYQQWIHPELNIHITGLQNSSGWTSKGANKNRQVARVKLADQGNRNNLINKAKSALLSIMKNKKTARVFIIAGLAGGTGSGTIVDVPYILREKVNGTHRLAVNFIIEGYLLLPPACGNETGDEAAAGNRNAYAALKEVDYYMTLREMHKANPQEKYSFCDIQSTDNIFDTCTLVDGMFANGGAVLDPSKLASETLAHTIVSSIADLTAKDAQGNALNKDADTFFGSASNISNQRATTDSQLLQADYTQCPREANYRFLACGYSEVIIPVDLMKLYVVNKVFERIWADYNKAFNIRRESAIRFLDDTGLTVKQIHEELKRGGRVPSTKLPDKALEIMQRHFKKNGPYYMINLLREVVDLLTDDYIEDQHIRNNGDWPEAKSRLKRYRGLLAELQHQDYSVYTVVIEQLQEILKNDAHILTDSRRHKETFRETFYWTPIDLSSSKAGQQAIKYYLDHLLNDQDIEDMANNFRDELVDNRDYWVDVFTRETKFDAAARIRKFIKDSIGDKIDDSVEDFLVKLYSGEYKATVASDNQEEALTKATAEIFNSFDTHSAPLAYMDTNDVRLFNGGHRYFILPLSANHVGDKLRDNHNVDPRDIYYGNAADRLICITMYCGVPAFFYRWVREGEAAYEQNVNSIGLHMDQKGGASRGGWADLPNLIPQIKKQNGLSVRERELFDEARGMLDRASRYQLAFPSPDTDSYHYILRILKSNPNLDLGVDLLESAKETVSAYIEQANHPFSIGSVLANEIPGIEAAHNLINDMVFDCKVLQETNLKYGSWDLKPGNANVCASMSSEQKEQYIKDLAVKLLCKSLSMKVDLKKAIELAEYSENNVAKNNTIHLYNQRMSDRLNTFRRLLVANVIYCKESVWEYSIDGAVRTLANFVNEKAIARQFNLYLAYLNFVNLSDEAYDELKDYYENGLPEEQKNGSYIENNRNVWYQRIQSLTQEHQRKKDFAMRNEDFAQKVQEADWRDQRGGVITAKRLTKFYKDLESDLQPTSTMVDEVKSHDVNNSSHTTSSESWVCSKCGKTGIPASSKFCPECGAKRGTWTCSSCGKGGIADSVKFCPECGTGRYPKPTIKEKWVCPKCGTTNIAADVKFCPECGAKRP